MSINGKPQNSIVQYSTDYVELMFQTWYRNGRPSYKSLIEMLPFDELGRKPDPNYLHVIFAREKWRDRANALDEDLRKRLENSAIDARVKMLEEHAQLAHELIDQSITYLRENGFDSSSSAIRAFVEGVKLERESRVPSEVLSKISTLPTPKLQERITLLLERMNSGENMSAEEFYGKESENEIEEGEYTDVE